MIDEFSNDIERVQALQSMLIAISTGQPANSSDYETNGEDIRCRFKYLKI